MSEADPDATLAALRAQGADRLDPVRFHYLEALARRTLQRQGDVRRILDAKLAKALAAYRQRCEQMQHNAKAIATPLENQRTSLAELTRYIEQHSPENIDGGAGETIAARAELKALRYFRNTWSKLSVDRQVAQAIEQAPENAGPLNSHMLIVRSLATMREISPDYLNRFMSYVDSLLWLDRVEKKSKRTPKKPLAAKTAKK